MRKLPRGRAARLWLRERLAVAERGSDVLEQKLHALTGEQRRLEQHRRETRRAWERAMAEARLWYRRAVVLGGSQQFELAQGEVAPPAAAHVRWQSTMGVAYPSQVDARLPDVGAVAAVGRSGALGAAAEAHVRAVAAGLDHAAASRAVELVETELVVTRRRLRALEHRWLPQLTASLRMVQLALDEEEREEMVRSSWAAGGRGRGAT